MGVKKITGFTLLLLIVFSPFLIIPTSAQETKEEHVGIPRIAVLVSDYDQRNTWHDILHAFLNHFGIAEYITFKNATDGMLSGYDIIAVAGDYLEERYLLRDLAYIPEGVLAKIKDFSDGGKGVIWFNRAGFHDENGRFMWRIPESIGEVLGIDLKFSWPRSVKVRFVENSFLTKDLNITRFELPREDWTYIDVKSSKAKVIAYFTYQLPTAPNSGVIAVYNRQNSGRSAYFLYNLDFNLPEAYYNPTFWRRLVLWLSKLDLEHYIKLPPFFDHYEMKSYWSAFTIRRDDWLVDNDERILELGIPVSALLIVSTFDWEFGGPIGTPNHMRPGEKAGDWYRRLYELYNLEVIDHTYDDVPTASDMAKSIEGIKEKFGFLPMGFAAPGGQYNLWNKGLIERFSPPFLHGAPGAYYPAYIGWKIYSGILESIKDPHIHWILSKGKVPYWEAWRFRFKQAASLGLTISTGWHTMTVTDKFYVYDPVTGEWPRIEDERPEDPNLVVFEKPIDKVLGFLNWAKSQYGDNVWFTTLGRVTLLDHMRYSVKEAKGSFTGKEYAIYITVDHDVYGLPLGIHGSIKQVEVDGKPHSLYKDDVIVLPTLKSGVHVVKVSIGKSEEPHVSGIGYKQPFLPGVDCCESSSNEIIFKLSQDYLYVTDLVMNVNLRIDMGDFIPSQVLVDDVTWSNCTFDKATKVLHISLTLKQESEVKIRHEIARFLEVKVIDGKGNPVTLANVSVNGLSKVTDLNGTAVFEGLSSGTKPVLVTVQDRTIYDKVVDVQKTSSIVADAYDVSLACLTIIVKVDSKSLTNTEVTVESSEGKVKLRTNEDGEAVIMLPVGMYSVNVFSENKEFLLEGDSELTIEMPEGRTVWNAFIPPIMLYVAFIVSILLTYISITRLTRRTHDSK